MPEHPCATWEFSELAESDLKFVFILWSVNLIALWILDAQLQQNQPKKEFLWWNGIYWSQFSEIGERRFELLFILCWINHACHQLWLSATQNHNLSLISESTRAKCNLSQRIFWTQWEGIWISLHSALSFTRWQLCGVISAGSLRINSLP